MLIFKISKGVSYTVDLKGVAIASTNNKMSIFLNYPEAAVWLLLVQGYSSKNAYKMLEAILGKNKQETIEFTRQCLDGWKNAGLIG